MKLSMMSDTELIEHTSYLAILPSEIKCLIPGQFPKSGIWCEGRYVFGPGDPVRGPALLTSGIVGVTHRNGIHQYLGPGDWVGVEDVLDGNTEYTCSAITYTDCSFRFTGDWFQDQIQTNTDLRCVILDEVRLQRATQEALYRHLLSAPTQAVIVAAVLDLARLIEARSSMDGELKFPYIAGWFKSQKTIRNLLSGQISRPTARQALLRLSEIGAIDVGEHPDKKIELPPMLLAGCIPLMEQEFRLLIGGTLQR